MRKLCRNAMVVMEMAFRHLEQQVPKPFEVPLHGSTALRYKEKSIEQAIIQKLARYLSGLNAMDVLLLNGFVQEQAVLQRTLDEIGEDIMFLSLALTTGETTDLHRRYLEAFFQEEFGEGVKPIDNTKRRDQIRRRKIRAYNARAGGVSVTGEDKSGAVISQTYSGYVHAASPHIMEMCGGDDFRFFTAGLLGTHRIAEHANDIWNYFYRGLVTLTVAAKAFGDEALVKLMYEHLHAFEQSSGTTFMQEART